MIKHVVMWRFAERAEGKTKVDNINKVRELLHGLKTQIEEIISLETGENIADSPAAYDLVLITEHKSLKDLENYRDHPQHMAAASFIGKVTVERVVVDFEY
jgi:hypothetical protein